MHADEPLDQAEPDAQPSRAQSIGGDHLREEPEHRGDLIARQPDAVVRDTHLDRGVRGRSADVEVSSRGCVVGRVGE